MMRRRHTSHSCHIVGGRLGPPLGERKLPIHNYVELNNVAQPTATSGNWPHWKLSTKMAGWLTATEPN